MAKADSLTLEIDGSKIMYGVDPLLKVIVKPNQLSESMSCIAGIKTSAILKQRTHQPFSKWYTLNNSSIHPQFTDHFGDSN